MKTLIAAVTMAAALSIPATSAHAGGWGYNSNKNKSYSSSLINVSPTVRTGNLKLLSGILNNSPILSGNSILSGNNTGLGILGSGTGLLNNIVKAPGKKKGGRR